MDVTLRDQEAGHTIHDYLPEPTAIERDDRSPARQSVSGRHAEGLVPPRRADDDSRPGHCRPHDGSRHSIVHRHAWLAAPRVDLFARVLGVVGVAVDVDPGSGRPSDVDRLGGSLLRTQPAGKYGAVPCRVRPGDRTRRNIGRENRVDVGDRAPGAGLEHGHAGDGRRAAALGCDTKRCSDRRIRGQVERVHDRRTQTCSEADSRGVEGMIVDDVVPRLPDGGVRRGKRRRGRARITARWAGGSVQGSCQRSRIDSGVDDRDSWYLRSGGRVNVDRMTSADQAARKIGHEGLRASALRLADR